MVHRVHHALARPVPYIFICCVVRGELEVDCRLIVAMSSCIDLGSASKSNFFFFRRRQCDHHFCHESLRYKYSFPATLFLSPAYFHKDQSRSASMSLPRVTLVAVQAICNHLACTPPNPTPSKARYHTEELYILQIAPFVFKVTHPLSAALFSGLTQYSRYTRHRYGYVVYSKFWSISPHFHL